MFVCFLMNAIACVWRSEDNLKESVFCYYHVGLNLSHLAAVPSVVPAALPTYYHVFCNK